MLFSKSICLIAPVVDLKMSSLCVDFTIMGKSKVGICFNRSVCLVIVIFASTYNSDMFAVSFVVFAMKFAG